jgi:hypothetical protein
MKPGAPDEVEHYRHCQPKSGVFLLTLWLAALSLVANVHAQQISPEIASVVEPLQVVPQPTDQQNPKASQSNQAAKQSQGAFIGGAIPISSPAVGNGATIFAGYIFPISRKDKVSPPSIIGGAAVLTDNGTRAWAAGTELYFNQDRYHLRAGFAHADLNYDFYGTGTGAGNAGLKFGLNQTGDVVFGEVVRRIFWETFIGPRFWFGTSTLVPQHTTENHPDLPPLGVTLDMRSIGFKVERETEENRFYPMQGSKFQFEADFFAQALGGTYTFQKYVMQLDRYLSVDKKQVLAYDLYACSTGGVAPFFGECIFGIQNELRGYPAGRYIDRKMLATQAEYRLALPWRLGLVAFGGLGEVAPKIASFNAENVLGSVGVGPRLCLSKKYHVNLRADVAWGKNGRVFSMGIGEAF